MTTENGSISINRTLNDEKYLWRYMDIHKLIDFITTSELHFTRLDKFIDQLEGVGLHTLQHRTYFSNDNKEDYESKSNLVSFEDAKKLYTYLDPINTLREQKRQFVNCWFKGDRESIAMWDLYSNSNSMALKVENYGLLNELQRISPTFVELYGNRLNFLGDSVKYLKLNPFDNSSKAKPSIYSAFNKDVAYQHECEYRFLIDALEEWIKDDAVDFFRLKINIHNIKATLICHPLMEDWKKENIKKLLNQFEMDIIVENSVIQLRS